MGLSLGFNAAQSGPVNSSTDPVGSALP